MILRLPIRPWMTRDPLDFSDWLDGVRLTQEEVDRELLMTLEAPPPALAAVAGISEEAHA